MLVTFGVRTHVENTRLETCRRQGRNGTSEVGTRDGEVFGESWVSGVVGVEAADVKLNHEVRIYGQCVWAVLEE